MPVIRFLLLRSFYTRPLRLFLSVLGIVIGVAGILSIGITNQTALKSVERVFNSTAGRANLIISSPAGDNKGIPEGVIRRRLINAQEIQLAAPVLRVSTMLVGDAPSNEVGINFFGASLEGLLLFGIDPELDYQIRDYQLVEGRFLSNNLDGREMVLVQNFALDKNLKVGDRVAIITPNGVDRYRLVGLMSKDGPGQLNNGRFGVVPLRTAQKAFIRTGYVDQFDLILQSYFTSGLGINLAKETLQAAVGSEYPVIAPASQGSRMTQMLSNYQIGLNFMSGIALFVGAFLIYNAFSMTVVERTREYGMLRTVGMTRSQVFSLVLVEASLIGLIGSIIGVVAGYLLSSGLTQLMGLMINQEMSQIIIPADIVLMSFLVGVFVTLLAAIIPAWQAGKISPLAAVRIRGTTKSGRWLNAAWLPGVILLVVSGIILYLNPFPYDIQFRFGSLTVFSLFLGGTLIIPASIIVWEKGMRPLIQLMYGNPGRLGSGNLQRQKLRTALTVAALMIGAAMIVIVQSMTSSFKGDLFEWINAYIGGDLFVTSSVPMRSDLLKRLQEINSVEYVTPLRYLDVKWVRDDSSEEMLTLMAIDPQTYMKVASILFTDSSVDPASAINRLASGDALFISSVIAEKYGLELGGQINLRTRNGVKKFDIAGIVVDFYNQGLVIHGSWNDMKRYFRIEDASAYLLKVEKNFSVSEVEEEIVQLYGKQDHLTVDSNLAIKQRILQLLNQAFQMFDVLALLAVVVASLGVINTLTMNVMERTQEIGMLRSIGMTRVQVVRMVLAEAMVMGLAGSVLGMGFGYILSRIFLVSMTAMSGYKLTFLLPLGKIIFNLVLVLIISQIAAVMPAVRAARTRILNAIQYE